jgi:hypothetical protein
MRPGQIVVSSEEVFDCIHDWHKFSTHMGQERTWNWCREKYYNISQELVRHYCMTCVACLKKNPSAKNTKGSRKPLQSSHFQERFQVDLIDMCKLRKRDPFGVLMHWIMTVKATWLVYLTALPRRRAKCVAYSRKSLGFLVSPGFSTWIMARSSQLRL